MPRALIVIDVQASFRARPLWESTSDLKIADQVNRLVRLSRQAGDLVVWVLHSEPGTGGVFDPALGHVRLMEELERAEGEPLIHKTSHNAFTTTNLQQLLTERGTRELTVCGIRTEQCVETTTRVASDLGYQVTFAATPPEASCSGLPGPPQAHPDTRSGAGTGSRDGCQHQPEVLAPVLRHLLPHHPRGCHTPAGRLCTHLRRSSTL